MSTESLNPTPETAHPLREGVLVDIFTWAELREDTGEAGVIFINDGGGPEGMNGQKSCYQTVGTPEANRGLRTLEWMTIVAQEHGGNIRISPDEGLSSEILAENRALARTGHIDNSKALSQRKVAVFLHGMERTDYFKKLLSYDPMKNRSQY